MQSVIRKVARAVVAGSNQMPPSVSSELLGSGQVRVVDRVNLVLRVGVCLVDRDWRGGLIVRFCWSICAFDWKCG